MNKTSFIYIIGIDKGFPIKIGSSRKPSRRVIELQIANSSKLFLHASYEVPLDYAKMIEKDIHKRLYMAKTIGEWFSVTIEEAKIIIEDTINNFDYTKITMAQINRLDREKLIKEDTVVGRILSRIKERTNNLSTHHIKEY